jgi:hypothetical protein
MEWPSSSQSKIKTGAVTAILILLSSCRNRVDITSQQKHTEMSKKSITPSNKRCLWRHSSRSASTLVLTVSKMTYNLTFGSTEAMQQPMWPSNLLLTM